MRLIQLYIASSLDGYIARPSGDVDWLDADLSDPVYGYDEFLAQVDTVLMGRKSLLFPPHSLLPERFVTLIYSRLIPTVNEENEIGP